MRLSIKRIRGFFRKPAMFSTPPSQRPMWYDAAAHARDFAERYAHDLDRAVAERMTELGIPDVQIGMPDDRRGIPWAAFHPLGKEGGYNSPDGRLVVESGLSNRALTPIRRPLRCASHVIFHAAATIRPSHHARSFAQSISADSNLRRQPQYVNRNTHSSPLLKDPTGIMIRALINSR